MRYTEIFHKNLLAGILTETDAGYDFDLDLHNISGIQMNDAEGVKCL